MKIKIIKNFNEVKHFKNLGNLELFFKKRKDHGPLIGFFNENHIVGYFFVHWSVLIDSVIEFTFYEYELDYIDEIIDELIVFIKKKYKIEEFHINSVKDEAMKKYLIEKGFIEVKDRHRRYRENDPDRFFKDSILMLNYKKKLKEEN